ncbi:hypothetical protein EUGRSUZ_C03126 [Eucalyptus grandis]|uniref:Uncharacterized protein n=2 Tax=Eucalyptus grandis TaxID=71139 RepID=A0ACC3LI51_EUCGR|nr:hypothetical protein EUGRSUZ_C03126 [Eucalyptus grandis]
MPIFRLEVCDTATALNTWYLPGISSSLRNSHFLETLTIYVYPGRDEDESELAEAGCKLAFEFNGFGYWSSVDSTFTCLEDQLKHVKIYGYVLEPDVIELIEFLLKNAQVLEKMEISTKKTLQQTEFSQKLLSYPGASTSAVIHPG